MNGADPTPERICPACGRVTAHDGPSLMATPISPPHQRCEVCGRDGSIDIDAAVADLRPRVIVAHDEEVVAAQIAAALTAAGSAPVCVKDGPGLLLAVDPVLPARASAAVVDVAITGVLVFEVIERIRRDPLTSTLPIILLASVHAQTRYKRPARRLYGADAVLELPEQLERLPVVVRSLVRERPALPGHTSTPLALRRLLSDLAIEDVSALERGLKRGDPFADRAAAVDTARARYLDGGGLLEDFEAERAAMTARLLARFGSRGASDE
jgi:DNA-binding response OmpR family regulator